MSDNDIHILQAIHQSFSRNVTARLQRQVQINSAHIHDLQATLRESEEMARRLVAEIEAIETVPLHWLKEFDIIFSKLRNEDNRLGMARYRLEQALRIVSESKEASASGYDTDTSSECGTDSSSSIVSEQDQLAIQDVESSDVEVLQTKRWHRTPTPYNSPTTSEPDHEPLNETLGDDDFQQEHPELESPSSSDNVSGCDKFLITLGRRIAELEQ